MLTVDQKTIQKQSATDLLKKLVGPRYWVAENSYMNPVAGLVNKLIVATPFVVVTTLGLHAHRSDPAFHYPAYSQTRNSEVSKYIPIVRDCEKSVDGYLVTEDRATQLAKRWIQDYKSGKLKVLPPIAADDLGSEGVKFQIVHDCNMIAESLQQAARTHIKAGQYLAGVKDGILAAQVVEAVKFFDYTTLSGASLEVRKAMIIVVPAFAHLSKNDRVRAKADFARLMVTPKNLISMNSNLRMLYSQQDGDPKEFSDFLGKPVANSMGLPKPVRDPSRLTFSTWDLADLYSDYRMGITSAADTNTWIKRAIQS
jgi:hypothetical protein